MGLLNEKVVTQMASGYYTNLISFETVTLDVEKNAAFALGINADVNYSHSLLLQELYQQRASWLCLGSRMLYISRWFMRIFG